MINTQMIDGLVKSATPVAAEIATEALKAGAVLVGALAVVEVAKVGGSLLVQGATAAGGGIAYAAEEAWAATEGARCWLLNQFFGDIAPQRPRQPQADTPKADQASAEAAETPAA